MKHLLPGVPVALALASVLLLQSPAVAEFSILVYLGKQFTADGKLHLKNGASDLTFSEVHWKDKSFSAPIFYGVRAGYWFDRAREWGVAVDFTHAKTILQEQETVPVRGTRNGTPVDGREPISDSIKHFELSHGLNMVTFNGLHRWFPVGSRDATHSGNLQCYTGLGAGFSIPHVEAHLKDDRTGKEEWTGRFQFPGGPVLNGLLGFNVNFTDALSGILEYKLSYADSHAELAGGGRIDAETLNNQLVTGVAGQFAQ